jgi:hypothetical protein
MQHPDKCTCKLQHTSEKTNKTLRTGAVQLLQHVQRPNLLCNIRMKHLQHIFKTYEIFETDVCNMLARRVPECCTSEVVASLSLAGAVAMPPYSRSRQEDEDGHRLKCYSSSSLSSSSALLYSSRS